MAANAGAAPETRFVALDAEELTNSCVQTTNQACLWLDTQGLVEVRLMNGEQEVARYLDEALPVMSLVLGNPGALDCIEVRTRDVAGQISQPARHCFDDARLPHLTRTDFPPNVLVDCTASAVETAMNVYVPAENVESEPFPEAGMVEEQHHAVATPTTPSVACSVGPATSHTKDSPLGSLMLLALLGATLTRRHHRA